MKIRRYLERQREHGRDFQKRGSSSEEKGPRGSITGTEPDDQCGQNGKFREGQRHAGVGGDTGLSGLAWRWNATMHKEEMVTKWVGKR